MEPKFPLAAREYVEELIERTPLFERKMGGDCGGVEKPLVAFAAEEKEYFIVVVVDFSEVVGL